jgi:hypothetical protein
VGKSARVAESAPNWKSWRLGLNRGPSSIGDVEEFTLANAKVPRLIACRESKLRCIVLIGIKNPFKEGGEARKVSAIATIIECIAQIKAKISDLTLSK